MQSISDSSFLIYYIKSTRTNSLVAASFFKGTVYSQRPPNLTFKTGFLEGGGQIYQPVQWFKVKSMRRLGDNLDIVVNYNQFLQSIDDQFWTTWPGRLCKNWNVSRSVVCQEEDNIHPPRSTNISCGGLGTVLR